MIILTMRKTGQDALEVYHCSNCAISQTCSGPLCPKPPDIPTEGKRDFAPIVFDQEVESSCAIEGETLKLQCHSFLNVYTQSASYGRSADNGGRTLCNGTKGEDSKAVAANQNCLDEVGITTEARQACHGQSSCSVSVTDNMSSLGSVCTGLKRELRTNHICGKLTVSSEFHYLQFYCFYY